MEQPSTSCLDSLPWANIHSVLRLICCGSRDWRDTRPLIEVLVRVGEIYGPRDGVTVIHGGQRGADSISATLAKSFGFCVHPEFANWTRQGLGAGPRRNRRMLKLDPQLVVALKDRFDYTLAKGGTENMVKIARLAGVPVFLYSHANGWEVIE